MANKTVFFFGDSIMHRDKKVFDYSAEYNKDELGKMCKGWPSILEEKFDFSYSNFAVGGDKISDQKEIILTKDFSKVDFVVIAVGINDFSNGTPIGTIPNSQEILHEKTFIGDYCTALDHIFKSNPLIKVMLTTPLHRCTLNRTSVGPKNTIDTKVNGNTLKDYADAIIEIGRFYSCYVVDMYSISGVNKFNLEYLTFEGVHPTNKGYEFTSPPLIDAFKKMGFKEK